MTNAARYLHPRPAPAAVIVLLMALVVTSPTEAGALANRGTSDEQAACAPDVFKLCAGEIPDEASIVACLSRNASRLGPECRRIIQPTPLARLNRSSKR